jgi:hypothetical protein
MKPVAVNHRLAGHLALLVITFLVPGCATRPMVVADSARSAQRPLFELIDQRPEDERTTRWLSNTNSSCVYTVRQFGDDAISPDRVTLLRDNLDSRLHSELTGKTLLVTHYGIYINSSQRSRSSGSLRGGFLQSMLDLAVESHIEHRCKPEEIAAGWLGSDDGKKAHSPVIIDITLSLDGRTLGVHSLYAPDREISIKTDDPDTASAISSAIKQATDQLITELPTT